MIAPSLISRIVIVADGALDALRILETALLIVRTATQATIVGLFQPGGPGDAQMDGRLAALAARHHALTVHWVGIEGDIRDALLDLITRKQIDLVIFSMPAHLAVTASSGHGSCEAWEEIVISAGIPVMLVRTEAMTGARQLPPQRVLVPFDGSAGAWQALGLASSIALGANLPLCLITVIDAGRGLPPAYAYMAHDDPERQDAVHAMEYAAHRDLCQAEADLQSLGVAATFTVLYGATIQCVRSTIRPDDLVITATRSAKHPGRSRVGDIATDIVHRTQQPVIVWLVSPSTLPECQGSASWAVDSACLMSPMSPDGHAP